MFARRVEEDFEDGREIYVLLDEDGGMVTRFPRREERRPVWPLARDGEPSGFSSEYEHPEGIYLTFAQVQYLGLEIES